MPRNDPQPTWESVSFLQLLAKIQGGTPFTVDQLVQQLDRSERSGEDFRISHQRVNYVVPVDQIREYFTTHPRPAKKLTPQEQVEFLTKRVKELEAKLAEHGLMEPTPVYDEQPRFERQGRVPVASEPQPEPEIPTGTKDGDKMTTEQIQDDLLKELDGKKPLTRDDKLVKNAKPIPRPTTL